MKELGSTIECYRGETFEVKRSFVDEDGVPLYITPDMDNPFVRFTVKSNKYKIDGEWKKNYWLDLSNFPKFKGTEMLTSDEYIPSEYISNLGYASFDEDIGYLHLNLNPSKGGKLSFKVDFEEYKESSFICLSTGPSYIIAFYITDKGTLGYALGSSLVDTGIRPSQLTPTYDVTFDFDNLQFILNNIVYRSTVKPPSGMSSFVFFCGDDLSYESSSWVNLHTITRTIDNVDVNYIPSFSIERNKYGFLKDDDFTFYFSESQYDFGGKFDTDLLYYTISEEGREYYSFKYEVNNGVVSCRLESYGFEIIKRFISHDTKQWTGQLYEYEIALCAGELMIDWLKKTYSSLYSDTPPEQKEELVHYICKKRPDLLKGVNVNEPLVTYSTNCILQKPSKLIVKEN